MVYTCRECNFFAKTKRLNVTKGFALLHQTLQSDCGQFYYIDVMHASAKDELIIGASCARCKLLKVKIVKSVDMQSVIDFITYDLSFPVIPQGIISDNASNIIGSQVKENIRAINQGLARYQFHKILGDYEDGDFGMIQDNIGHFNKERAKKRQTRRDTLTASKEEKLGQELQVVMKTAMDRKCYGKYKPENTAKPSVTGDSHPRNAENGVKVENAEEDGNDEKIEGNT